MEENILKIIFEAGEGATLKEIEQKTGIKQADLKRILKSMEKKGLLEERHFIDGSTDYSIENKGIEFLKGKK